MLGLDIGMSHSQNCVLVYGSISFEMDALEKMTELVQCQKAAYRSGIS